MTCYSEEVVKAELINNVTKELNDTDLVDLETDNDGQLIVYSGIYRWQDGSYHNIREWG